MRSTELSLQPIQYLHTGLSDSIAYHFEISHRISEYQAQLRANSDSYLAKYTHIAEKNPCQAQLRECVKADIRSATLVGNYL